MPGVAWPGLATRVALDLSDGAHLSVHVADVIVIVAIQCIYFCRCPSQTEFGTLAACHVPPGYTRCTSSNFLLHLYLIFHSSLNEDMMTMMMVHSFSSHELIIVQNHCTVRKIQRSRLGDYALRILR